MSIELASQPSDYEIPQSEYVGILATRPYVEVHEPAGVRLVDAPIHVLRTEVDDLTTRYDAVFEHPPLRDDSLLNFLKEASPDNGFASVFGVIADWNLPDAYPNSNLLASHVTLGRHWTDFEASRALFMRALSQGTSYYETIDTNHYSYSTIKLHSPQELAKRFEALWPRMNFYDGRRVYDGEAFPNFVQAVAKYILETGQVNARDAARMASGRTSKATARLYNADRRYSKRYYQSLSDEQKALALENYIRQNYKAIDLENDEMGYFGNHHDIAASELLSAYHRRRTLPIRMSDKDVDVSTVTIRGKERDVVFPHTVRPGMRDVGLQPVVSWQTTEQEDGTMKRLLLIDSHDPTKLRDLNKHIYASVLTGLLCVAYLSPDIRSAWPKAVGLAGQERIQQMGAAQVPVLALMRRKQLLNSPLVQAIEEFAA
jgi:hypothetical protein